MINIVVTSKPVDGLFYYSYEYCTRLNELGIDAQVVVITHRNFSQEDYERVITNKYIHFKNIVFDIVEPEADDVTLIMGRSMMTLSWKDFKDYDVEQQQTLRRLFGNKVISVYSENHPTEYPKAVEFYAPKQIVILTYDADYVNIKNNNIFVPVDNVMSMFETYVYTKATFDPAPRIFQECKYYGKDVIYLRDKTIVDGGSVYWKRDIREPDVTSILNALEELR